MFHNYALIMVLTLFTLYLYLVVFQFSTIFVFCSVPIVLVGNKTDLHMERMIPYEEGRRLAEEWKAIFLEASAKQNAVSSLVFRFY